MCLITYEYIVAIGENLFHIDSLNDGMQFFQGLEIWLGAMKSVNGGTQLKSRPEK